MSREMRAQALVLESVLTQRPLPGMAQSLAVPGLAVDSDTTGQIILVDDRSASELDFSSLVRVMTRKELEGLAPDVPAQVLEFQSPEHFPGKISVRLRHLMAFPGHGLVPNVEVVATFIDNDLLTVTEPTHVLAF